MIFDGDFDMEDGAVFGGIVGFVEESIKNEKFDEDETGIPDDRIEDYVDQTSNSPLRFLYNENPELVRYLINKAYKERIRTAEVITEKEIEAVKEEMLEELQEQEENGSG
jgi:hypothetical protein